MSHFQGGIFPIMSEFFPIPILYAEKNPLLVDARDPRSIWCKKTLWVAVKIFLLLLRESSVICKAIFRKSAETLSFFYSATSPRDLSTWSPCTQAPYLTAASMLLVPGICPRGLLAHKHLTWQLSVHWEKRGRWIPAYRTGAAVLNDPCNGRLFFSHWGKFPTMAEFFRPFSYCHGRNFPTMSEFFQSYSYSQGRNLLP